MKEQNDDKIIGDLKELVASSSDLITERNMQLLHAVPILKCDENSEEFHMKEINNIYEKLSNMKVFENKLAVRVEHADIAHNVKSDSYYLVNGIEELEELIQGHDLKNGGDFGFDNGTLILATYGQGYEYRGVSDLVKEIFYINPTLARYESGTITKEFYEDLHKITVSAEMRKLSKMITNMRKLGKARSDRNR